jgi:hypothetical protein
MCPAIFNLKYYRKRVRRPKNLVKERTERVLHRYLLAHQAGATTHLPSGSLTIQEPVYNAKVFKPALAWFYVSF